MAHNYLGVESPGSHQQERYISVIEIGFSSNKSMRSSITLGLGWSEFENFKKVLKYIVKFQIIF